MSDDLADLRQRLSLLSARVDSQDAAIEALQDWLRYIGAQLGTDVDRSQRPGRQVVEEQGV